MIIISIATISVHVNSAIEFKNKISKLWFGLGGTQPWNDEEQPPIESMYTTDLSNLIGMKQVEKALLVVPITSANGTDSTTGLPLPPVDSNQISVGGHIYQPVSDADAYKYYARYLYLEADLEAGDFPNAVYRQIGIYEGTTSVPDKKDSNILLPDDISNNGVLDGYDNIKFHRLDENTGVKLRIILEF